MAKDNKSFTLGSYFIGGLIALLFVFIAALLGNAMEDGFLLFYIIAVFAFLIVFGVLFNFSKHMAFGFLGGVASIILFIALTIIELTIHPPSEE